MNRQAFGKSLKAARQTKGLGPQMMAEIASLSLGQVLDCEMGNGTEAEISAYCKALERLERKAGAQRAPATALAPKFAASVQPPPASPADASSGPSPAGSPSSEIAEQPRPTARRIQGARRASEISRFSVAREPRALGQVGGDYVPIPARELEP